MIREVRGTTVIVVDAARPDLEMMRRAAGCIRGGRLVAFPTETVYGLGANALDAAAVWRIFAAKGRPADNPLIVHIAAPAQLDSLVRRVPDRARRLARRFWPGPLTLVLPRADLVPDAVTAGLDTVAVRMPAHPVALALISLSGMPLAAPSANLSGRPSPTTAEHVLDDLAGKIEMVIDAGPTGVGVESTVLDLTGRVPTVLRPGGVTVEELRGLLGEVAVAPPAVRADGPARSPGTRYRHYSPRTPLLLVEGEPAAVARKVAELAASYRACGRRVGVLALAESLALYRCEAVEVVGSRSDPATVAGNLFRCMRRLDGGGLDIIIAEGIEETGLGLAVMNRLRRAAGEGVVRV